MNSWILAPLLKQLSYAKNNTRLFSSSYREARNSLTTDKSVALKFPIKLEFRSLGFRGGNKIEKKNPILRWKVVCLGFSRQRKLLLQNSENKHCAYIHLQAQHPFQVGLFSGRAYISQSLFLDGNLGFKSLWVSIWMGHCV